MAFVDNQLQLLLVRYLKARGSQQQALLQELADGIEARVYRRIARYQHSERDDIARDCIVSLLCYLDRLRGQSECPISNFDGFVLRTVDNHMMDEFRRANPERRRIAMIIEHLLNGGLNAAGLVVWPDPKSGAKVAGFDAWRNKPARPLKSRLDDPHHREAFVSKCLKRRSPEELDMPDLVAALLNWHGAPMMMDALVDVVCGLQKVQPVTILSTDGGTEEMGTIDLPMSGPSLEDQVTDRLEHHDTLRWAWKQIQFLKFHQIAAICLKLEPDEFMVLIAIAGADALAAALQMDKKTLAEYACKLPLSDAEIAEIVGPEVGLLPGVRDKVRKRLNRHLEKNNPTKLA